jgi:hypothetical protein
MLVLGMYRDGTLVYGLVVFVLVSKNQPELYALKQYQLCINMCLLGILGNTSSILGLLGSQYQIYICCIPIQKSALDPHNMPQICMEVFFFKISLQQKVFLYV